MKIFRNSPAFYMKTMVVYGVLLACIYSPSMHHEQRHDVTQDFSLQGESVAIASFRSEDQMKQMAYPYARMMNLIEQSRSVEADFHRDTVDFALYYEEKVDLVKDLFGKVDRIKEKLLKEKDSFCQYVSQARISCSKYSGKPLQRLRGTAALSRKERQKRTTLYIMRVLDEYIRKMEIMSSRLGMLLEKIRIDDEQAKIKSEALAKEMMKKKSIDEKTSESVAQAPVINYKESLEE